jgi:hypothetical protein
MKRLLLLTLAIAVAISVVAVMGIRSLGGSTDVASAAGPTIAIDVVQDAGGTWCNPIDSVTTVNVGTVHQAAICLSDVTTVSPGSFGFELNYDVAGTLNSCTDTPNQAMPALDSNPDANVGATVFSGNTGAGNLGTGCDCSSGGLGFPTCDYWAGSSPPDGFTATEKTAYISCVCASSATLPIGAGVSSVLAVVTYTATGVGSDVLGFGTASVYPGPILRCPSAGCLGATVIKQLAPTNTPIPPTNTPLPATATPTPTVTPTPPAHPPECDIGELGPIALNPPTVFMKVGAPPAIVDMADTWKNFGHVSALGVDATCSVGFAMGAQLQDNVSGVQGPIPAGISVRVEPFGAPNYAGDVCLICNPYNPAMTGHPVGDCLLGHGPFDSPPSPQLSWTYIAESCDEGPYNPAVPMSALNKSCEDGIDNNANGTCDWAGFSKACATPTTADPLCKDVPAIGIQPLVRWIAAPGATHTVTREIKVQCNAPGVYQLVVFGSSTQAKDVLTGLPADPNPANDTSYGLLTVNCAAEMNKDCDVSTPGIQTSCNLWLMNPKFKGGVEFGTNPPVTLPPADANGCVLPEKGKGCLAVDVWVSAGAGDLDDTNDLDTAPECLGAWEHQVRYDHKIISFVDNLNPITVDTNGDTVLDSSWLESTGRVANCSVSVLAENWILEGCITTSPPESGAQCLNAIDDDKDGWVNDGCPPVGTPETGWQCANAIDDDADGGYVNDGCPLVVNNGPCGSGVIERMLIIPQTVDLISRGVFRPTKMNGVVTNIVDDNCEITDIYSEPFGNTLPGGLTAVCGNLSITVRMLEGDTDLDCDVDVADDQAIAFRYGSSFGLQLYDQWYDLEPKYADQDIDIKDLQFIFGRNYSTCQNPIPDDQSIPVPPAQPDP